MHARKTAGRCALTPPCLPISKSTSTAARCEGARVNDNATASTSVGGLRAAPRIKDCTRLTRSAAPTLRMTL